MTIFMHTIPEAATVLSSLTKQAYATMTT